MFHVICSMLRNGFTKKRVGTMTLGERLRQFRLDKRMSLGEISRITKIQTAYLEYLEDGDYDKLPADVYVKGFLRSYGDFLGVDGKILVKLYEKEKGIRKNLEESKNPQAYKIPAKPVNISSFVFTPQKMALYLVIIVIISGLTYLYKEIGSFADAPRLVVFSPQTDTTIESNSLYVEGVTDKDASLFINDQPILVNDDGKFKENITLQSGMNTINLRALNKFGKETGKAITIQSNYKGSETASNSESENGDRGIGEDTDNNNELQLELRVDPGPVWLSVEADGNLVFSGTMLSGATQSFKANDKIVVNSGRASATYVKFNGKDIGTLGSEPGAVRGVTFTRDTKY